MPMKSNPSASAALPVVPLPTTPGMTGVPILAHEPAGRYNYFRCHLSWGPKMKTVSRLCPVCKRNYEANPVRLSHGRQTTCGRACSYQLRAASMSRPIPIVCSVCSKQFTRSPSTVKSKHQGVYCSRTCHYAGRGLGTTKRVVGKPYTITAIWDRSEAGFRAAETRKRLGNNRHTEATRERLRDATSRHIASQTDGIHVSKIEDEVAQELTRREILFRRQVGIRNPANGRFVACADFLLAERIVLEVNGTFWHSDRLFYPDGPKYPAQKRTAEAYARKIAYLAAASIPFVEVWEADLSESVEHAVGQALQAAGL